MNKELMPTSTSMISTTNSDQVEGAKLPAAGGFAAQRITIAGGEDDDSQNEPGGMTFTLFKKLPAELRVKIWRFSLPGASLLWKLMVFFHVRPDLILTPIP